MKFPELEIHIPPSLLEEDEEVARLRRRVSALEARLARVCAYAERAFGIEGVKRERNPTTNEILGTTRFNPGGSVWSRSRSRAGKGER